MNHVWAFRWGPIYVNVTEIVSKCVSSWEAHLSESFWKCSSRRILKEKLQLQTKKKMEEKTMAKCIRGTWKCRIQELNSRVIVSGVAVKSLFWMWGDKRGLDVYFFYFPFPRRLLRSSELFVFWVCVFTSFCYCVRPMKWKEKKETPATKDVCIASNPASLTPGYCEQKRSCSNNWIYQFKTL